MNRLIVAGDHKGQWGSEPSHNRVWLTTGDAARVLRVSRQAVWQFVKKGLLACERTLRGQVLFRQDDVRELATARVDAALVTVRPSRIVTRCGLARPRQQKLFGVQLRMVKALSPRRDRLTIVNRKRSGS